MLETFCGLVTPPCLIWRRGEAADGVSRVWRHAWSLTTEVLLFFFSLSGRVELLCVAVCVCCYNFFGWGGANFTSPLLKLQSCHKNWRGVKCTGARAQPMQQGAPLVLVQVQREGGKGVGGWGAVNQRTFERLCLHCTLYSCLTGSAAPISPCLCVWLIKLKKEHVASGV